MVRWIRLPVEIWGMTELQPGQRILLALVDGFTVSGNGCLMNNAALAQILGVSPRTVSRWIAQMKEMGLVDVQTKGGHRVTYRVDKAMTWGGGQSYDVGGRQSHVHHIERERKNERNIIERETMKKPDVEDVARFMATTPRVQECRMPVGEIRRMAADAVSYYNGTGWTVKDGSEVKQWKPLMRSWAVRALKDYRPPQRRPQKTEDELRRDMQWHARRATGYLERGLPHLAESEQQSIKAIQHALDAMVNKRQ